MVLDLNVPLLIDGTSWPGYIVTAIPDLDHVGFQDDAATDTALLAMLERIARCFPDAVFALAGWIPTPDRCPRTCRYLMEHGAAAAESIPPEWKRKLLEHCGLSFSDATGDPSRPHEWHPPRLPGSEINHVGPLEVSPSDDAPYVYTALTDHAPHDDRTLFAAMLAVTQMWPDKRPVTVGWHAAPERWPLTAALMRSVDGVSDGDLRR